MRQLDLVERLLERAADSLGTAARMPAKSGDLEYFEGQACGFFCAAEHAADFPGGWPAFHEWKAWMLEAIAAATLSAQEPGQEKHEPQRRDFHRCRNCLRKNYEPLTRCEHCAGELLGVTYAKGAA